MIAEFTMGEVRTPSNRIRHIVVICPALAGGGAVANVALRQATELACQFHVTLISNSLPVQGLVEATLVPLNPWRFDILRRYSHVPNEVAFALAARRAVSRLHQKSSVDMVICHGHAVASLAALALWRAYAIPYALVTHGDIFDRPRGTYDARLTRFYKWVTPPAYRGAALVIALSPHMAKLAVQGGASEDCVALIPNGIDPTDIGLTDKPGISRLARQGQLKLLFVGRLSVEKGVDTLLEAAALLLKGGVPFHLKIAGKGGQERDLREQVSKLQLGRWVEFIGSVPRNQLGTLYRAADVVCVPSLSDPLPTVVLEAMAAGAAVVGTDAGGIPFMVSDGVCGLICPAGNALALANALKRFAAEADLAVRMGRAGHFRAHNEFSWGRIGHAMAERIQLVCDQQSAVNR